MRGAKDDSNKVGLCNCIKVIDIYWYVKDCLGAGWGRKSVGIKLKRVFFMLICIYLLDFQVEISNWKAHL